MQSVIEVRSTCPYCGVGCGVVAGGGCVVGDKLHPANAGRLCSKGAALADTLGHEGRLLYPEIDGARVSWDEAIGRVADGFGKIIAEHGPDAVAFYVSGQLLTEDYYVANKLMKGFIGSGNIDTNSRLCMSTAVAAHKRAFGADAVPVCYEDVELADLVVITGSNLAWAHPVLYQRLVAAKRLRPEMKVIVIDPRRTATCDIADLHLAIAPGSDAFLFNGLLHHLRREDALDLAYIESHVDGFAAAFEAARHAGGIAEVAQVCGIDELQLIDFYNIFSKTEKTLTIFSQGINQSSSGVDKANSIINVHLATGRIGRPGMGPFSVTGQPNAMGGREVGGLANQLAAHMDFADAASIALVSEFWHAPNIAKTPGLKAVDMFRAIANGKIKAVWIMGTNPAVSLPDADRVRDALLACELVVVSDCVRHTDTTACADILLPALAWGEKDGTVTNSERCISRQRAFLPAPGEAKADWWIISQLARRLGFAGEFAYTQPAQIFREHARLSGFKNEGNGHGNFTENTFQHARSLSPTLSRVAGEEANERMREFHFPRAFDISAWSEIEDNQYDALLPTQWPVHRTPPLLKGGLEGFKGTTRLFADGRFYTKTGRAYMVAIEPRLPARDADYPFVLNTGRIRDQWHTMTRTGNVPRLNAQRPETFVELRPCDAAGMADGSLAHISSRFGSMLARVQLSSDQRKGSLFVPMHWSDTFARAARVDALVAPVTDPISGQPESKHSAVCIEPFNPAWQGFLLHRARLELAGLPYCARSKGATYWRHELAGEALPANWRDWLSEAAGPAGEWMEYRDQAKGIYRAAIVSEGRLQAVLFVAVDHRLPGREWLAGLFDKPSLELADLAGLLAARPPKGCDIGRTVCACYGVGEKTLQAAIRDQGLKTVDAVGQCTRAGTGCGSCVPEIRRLLV